MNRVDHRRRAAFNRAGFTFLELLVGVMIFSMLSVAVYSSFSIGVRAWRKGEEEYRSRQEIRYLVNTLSRELRGAIRSSVIKFSGGNGLVTFCRASNGIYRVTYFYDPESRTVYKATRTYSENDKGEAGTISKVASNLSEFSIAFAYKEDGKVVWQGSWDEENDAVPYGVKISFRPSAGEKQYLLTVPIPTGTLKENEGP